MIAIFPKSLHGGTPLDIAACSLLAMTVAQATKLQPRRMAKTPPVMEINPDARDIFSFAYQDFELAGRTADESIKASGAV